MDRKDPYRRPQIHEDTVKVRGCPTPLRQIAVRGLGHDNPTLVLTNNTDAKPGLLVNRYAKRMAIEQRLAETIRTFHLDALSSAVVLNVDLDTTLTVWAYACYDLLAAAYPATPTPSPTPSGAGSSTPWTADHHLRRHHRPPAEPHLLTRTTQRRLARRRRALVERTPPPVPDRPTRPRTSGPSPRFF